MEDKISKYEISDNAENNEKVKKLEERKVSKNNELQEGIKKQAKNYAEVKMLQETLSKIGTDQDECPVCLRGIEEHDIQHIETRKKEITEDIETRKDDSIHIGEKINEYKKEIELFDKTISLLKNNINKNNLLIQQKKNDEDKLKILKNQLSNETKAMVDLENFKSEESKATNGDTSDELRAGILKGAKIVNLEDFDIVKYSNGRTRSVNRVVSNEMTKSKVFSFNGTINRVASESWDIEEVDLKNGKGVYVIIDKYQPLAFGNIHQLSGYIASFKKAIPAMQTDMPKIYGIRHSSMGSIGSGWVEFRQWANTELRKYIDKNN